MDGVKILVVDDDAFIRRPLEFLLAQEGFEVRTAVDGDDCLAQLAADDRPDLILLDVMMPGKSGYDVCAEIRSEPRTATIPVMLLSARAQDEDRLRGLEVGAQEYLIKPYVPADLLEKVRALVGLPAVG